MHKRAIAKDVEVTYVPIVDQEANILTKPMGKLMFQNLLWKSRIERGCKNNK
jgi:hypothetical protein